MLTTSREDVTRMMFSAMGTAIQVVDRDIGIRTENRIPASESKTSDMRQDDF